MGVGGLGGGGGFFVMIFCISAIPNLPSDLFDICNLIIAHSATNGNEFRDMPDAGRRVSRQTQDS